MLLAQSGPDPGALLGGMLCVLIFGVVIGTLVGAIILRAACWLFNKFAGGPQAPGAISEPSFGTAMLIVFVATLLNGLISLSLGGVVSAAGANPQFGQLIGLPVSLLVLAGMTSAMLPTTFGKGLLVAVLYLVIGICIAVAVIVPLMIVAFLVFSG